MRQSRVSKSKNIRQEMNTSSAIYVRNVVKNYGGKTILDGFSMTVERGTIYGLLGSSGCGKTTLLSCIVGRKSVASGEIWVLGSQKGNDVPGPRVGYMPQELALVEEFTIKDTIYYFGTIFNMKSKEIKERLSELTNLLDLPPEDKFLKNCSGGQKRRVSLAAALVHNPELLILDEPTVGLDPILREKIWDYLRDQVTKNKITVIITTHYIEETKEANKIGLMRGGKLLVQESPTRLLSTYHTNTLEEVFFILSQKQEREERPLSNDISTLHHQYKHSSEPVVHAPSVESFAMGYGSQDELTKSSVKRKTKVKSRYMSALSLNKNRMKALLNKNWKQFYRNVGGLLFLVTFPIVQLWFFMNSVGTDPKGLNLGIVNNESSTNFCSNVDWNGTAVSVDYDCHFQNLACQFLNYLEHPMINKVSYNSLSDAVEGVKHGEIIGALFIPNNFTESYEERIREATDAPSWITDFGEIKAYMDMSNRQLGPILVGKLLRLFIDFQKKLFVDCNLPEKLAGIPMQREFLFGDDMQPMTYFITPGMVIMLVYLLGSTMTSNILVKEKIDGIWDRSIVAGVSSLEITLAHLLLEGAIMFFQCVECLIMLFAVLKMQYMGELYALFILLYLAGLCGMAYGYFISSLCNGVTQANLLCTGGYLPLLLIGGLIWPIEAMPTLLRIFSMCLPCTVTIVSFRNVMSKGWPVWDSQVINGAGITLTWIAIFVIASVWIIKIRN